MTLDFTNIKTADDWELFSRDFFAALGYKIIEDPARGADGGKDLIIEEILKGINSEQSKRWLVSCKHYAQSSKAISCSIESNISDRIVRHNCQGFIGFYSTLATSDLQTCLQQIETSTGINYQIFDYRKIESLLFSKDMNSIIEQYFGIKNTGKIANLVATPVDLKCDICGENLLKSDYKNIIVYFENRDGDIKTIQDIGYVCKGSCDRQLVKSQPLLTSWEDISDLMIPQRFLTNYFGFIKHLNNNQIRLSEQAVEKFIHYNLAIAQTIFRDASQSEIKRFMEVSSLPDYI